jgi:two-component system, sensor histidine kinase
MPFEGETVAVTQGSLYLPTSVLVVDDEQVVLDVLKIALKKGGYTATCVTSAEDAFTALAKEQFGAVLTDKNLPGKNGLEIIKEAKRRYPYCACLLMTGYANTESVVEAMRLGANDYLEKPFSELGLVLQRLKAAFENQRVAFERAALADGLRQMELTLKKSEHEVFTQRTELELLQHVVDLQIDDATRELVVGIAQVEGERDDLLTKLKALRQVLAGAAQKCAEAGKQNGLTLEQARSLLAELEKQLAAEK